MSEELIATIAVSIIGSQALLEVVKSAIQARKEKKKKPSDLEQGLRWLLQDKLEYLATREIQRGETTVKMKSFLRRGYEIYHLLDGNGDMRTIMEEYEGVPVKY